MQQCSYAQCAVRISANHKILLQVGQPKCKTLARFDALMQTLEEDQPGPTVKIDKIFEEDREFNQGTRSYFIQAASSMQELHCNTASARCWCASMLSCRLWKKTSPGPLSRSTRSSRKTANLIKVHAHPSSGLRAACKNHIAALQVQDAGALQRAHADSGRRPAGAHCQDQQDFEEDREFNQGTRLCSF